MLLVLLSLRIAGVLVDVTHADDGGEACDVLAIRADDGWHEESSCWESFAGNMTVAPHDSTRGREQLLRGTLADGSAAVVLRQDSRDRDVDREHERVVARWRETHVLVCSVDVARGCAHETWRCARKGCGKVSLRKGVLRGGGRRHATVDL